MYIPPETPVFIRHRDSGDIRVERVDRLCRSGSWKAGSEEGSSIANLLDIDVWSGKGWSTVKNIHRKLLRQEPMYNIYHPKGYIMASLDTGYEECHKLPDFPELASDCPCSSNVYKDAYFAQEEFSRLLALQREVRFYINKNGFYVYDTSRGDASLITEFETDTRLYNGYVYTFELEDSEMFQAGFGKLCIRGVPCSNKN